MEDDVKLRRRGRAFRMTIGGLMLATAAVALAAMLAARIDPFYRTPHRQAIDELVRWCSTPTSGFRATYHHDPANPAQRTTLDKPPLSEGNCVYKMSSAHSVLFNDKEGVSVYREITALGEDGRLQHNAMYYGSTRGSVTQLSPEQMRFIKQALAALPYSQTDITIDGPVEEGNWIGLGEMKRFRSNALVIGFRSWGFWVTRVYDQTRLPPEVERLLNGL